MNNYDIKRVIGKLEPEPELKQRLSEKIEKGTYRRISLLPAAAAILIMIAGTGIWLSSNINNNGKTQTAMGNPRDKDRIAAPVPDSKLLTPNSGLKQSEDNSSAVNIQPFADKPDQSSESNRQADISVASAASASNNLAPSTSASSTSASPDDSTNVSLEDKTADNSGAIGSDKTEGSANVQPLARNSYSIIKPQLAENNNEQNQGIYIPQVPLPDNAMTTAKMMGLISYQGRTYLQNPLPIEEPNASKLIGQKLGTTKPILTEESAQEAYEGELASTVGVQDVYTVKGYNPSFRIMTYNGTNQAYFFECLNDITVKSGADIFGRFKIENNIKLARYEDFASWNNGRENYQALRNLNGLNNFLTALENSVPEKELDNLLLENQDSADQKFLDLKLNDGSELQLRLFKNGYVYYDGLSIVFKLDSSAFNAFWKDLN